MSVITKLDQSIAANLLLQSAHCLTKNLHTATTFEEAATFASNIIAAATTANTK